MICCDSKFTYMEQSCYRDCSSLTGLSIKTDNGDTSHGANKSGICVTTTECRQIKGKKKISGDDAVQDILLSWLWPNCPFRTKDNVKPTKSYSD